MAGCQRGGDASLERAGTYEVTTDAARVFSTNGVEKPPNPWTPEIVKRGAVQAFLE